MVHCVRIGGHALDEGQHWVTNAGDVLRCRTFDGNVRIELSDNEEASSSSGAKEWR